MPSFSIVALSLKGVTSFSVSSPKRVYKVPMDKTKARQYFSVVHWTWTTMCKSIWQNKSKLIFQSTGLGKRVQCISVQWSYVGHREVTFQKTKRNRYFCKMFVKFRKHLKYIVLQWNILKFNTAKEKKQANVFRPLSCVTVFPVDARNKLTCLSQWKRVLCQTNCLKDCDPLKEYKEGSLGPSFYHFNFNFKLHVFGHINTYLWLANVI